MLSNSVDRIRATVERLSPDQRRGPAYPSEWTIADVISHLASAAEIFAFVLDGAEMSPQPIWDQWNAKDPDAKVEDGLAALRAFVERVDAMSPEARDDFETTLGPLQLDLAGLLRTRINEQTLHHWDIEVMSDPTATLAAEAVPFVLEALPMIAGFAGRPTGSQRALLVHTTDPVGRYVVHLTTEGVTVAATTSDDASAAVLTLPAEAFIRLVYGRLDPTHTPAFTGIDADLEELRRAFPGV